MRMAAIDAESDDGPARSRSVPDRFCIATREVRPVGELMRFVAAPDGKLVADLKRKLPGRGVWVTARRALVAEAVRRHAFARSLKTNVAVPADLSDQVEGLLERSALDALAMAHKAGQAICGFVRVETAVQDGVVVGLVRAEGAGEAAGRKLASAMIRRLRSVAGSDHDENIIAMFSSQQLDLAFGRLNVVHAALLAGRASETFLARWRNLFYFRVDDPIPGSRPPDARESGS
jgi:predicted RNA-binding protein YlxR (DUF448 family)